MHGLSIPKVPPAPADAVRSLVDVSNGLGDAFFSATQRTLRVLLSDSGLLRHLPPAGTGKFSRRLLYSDPVNRFGIWVLDWPSGFQTPIHNHHCSCAFGVYRGSIEEILYSIDRANDVANESGRFERAVGYVGGASLEHGLVHEMLNARSEPAVTVHVYAYRPDRFDDSIDRCFAPRSRVKEM